MVDVLIRSKSGVFAVKVRRESEADVPQVRKFSSACSRLFFIVFAVSSLHFGLWVVISEELPWLAGFQGRR